jgi:hypothetical protein
MRSRWIVWNVLGALCVAGAAGCDTGLVTNYQPRRLGDSPAARRAYYAGKFTPEAKAAEDERAQELRSRRPSGGGGERAMPGGGPPPY